jgi:hypothetical protein
MRSMTWQALSISPYRRAALDPALAEDVHAALRPSGAGRLVERHVLGTDGKCSPHHRMPFQRSLVL